MFNKKKHFKLSFSNWKLTYDDNGPNTTVVRGDNDSFVLFTARDGLFSLLNNQ